MYTSVSDAEYRMRRAKAEREARSAYARASASPPHKQEDPPLESAAASALSSSLFGGVRSLLSRVKEDDLLILDNEYSHNATSLSGMVNSTSTVPSVSLPMCR